MEKKKPLHGQGAQNVLYIFLTCSWYIELENKVVVISLIITLNNSRVQFSLPIPEPWSKGSLDLKGFIPMGEILLPGDNEWPC